MAGLPRLGRRGALRLASVLLATALVPAAARAHGSIAIGDFYGGLLQPVYHLDALLLLLALSLWAGQLGEPGMWRAPFAFIAATLVGAGVGLAGLPLPPAAWLVRGGTLVLGLLVAARRAPPGAVALALALVLGLGHGHCASFADRAELQRPVLYALGLCLGPLLVWGQVVSLMIRLEAFWAQIAFRVVGSWIATVALLVSALELAGPAR